MPESSARPTWTEAERLAALRSYGVLDTAPEPAFDDIVRLAGLLLDAPIVAVNLIDAHRQWFKSEIGLGVREMPLDDSICKFVLLESERMVVPDTRTDARFNCNPLVTGGPGLRFYAGELLKTDSGLPLGTLCVLDTEPRPGGLTELQALTLKTLAQQVLTQLELRKVVFEQERLLTEQRRTHAELQRAQERSRLATEAAGLGIWSWSPDSDAINWENSRPYEILGLPRDGGPPTVRQFMHEYLHPDDAAGFAAAIASTVSNRRAVPLPGPHAAHRRRIALDRFSRQGAAGRRRRRAPDPRRGQRHHRAQAGRSGAAGKPPAFRKHRQPGRHRRGAGRYRRPHHCGQPQVLRHARLRRAKSCWA